MDKSRRWISARCLIGAAGLGIVILMYLEGCSENNTQSGPSPTTWLTALRASVKDADTLVVVIRGGCEESLSEPQTFQVKGQKDVHEFLELIEINYYTGEHVSMCGGRDTFEFLQADKSLATLNRTPMTVLTWNSDDWKGDAVVSQASYHRIIDWFDSRGFKYFREELNTAEESVRQQREFDEAFVASFPREIRPLILSAIGKNGEIDTAHATGLMPDSNETWVSV